MSTDTKTAPAAAASAAAKAAPAASSAASSPLAMLKALRAVMREQKLDAYIVPTADAHQSEYVADCDKRRAALSGFTGSAGTALVTVDAAGDGTTGQALLWTDGRYFLQASQQLAAPHWTLMKSGQPDVPTLESWLVQHMKPGARVGYDSTTLAVGAARRLEQTVAKKVVLVPSATNLVDGVWPDRPPMPRAPAVVHPLKYAGWSTADKLAKLRAALDSADNKDDACHALVVTALDEVAWLFNLRGADVHFNPVFFAYGLVTRDRAVLYVDPAKVAAADVQAHLGPAVTLRAYTDVWADLKALPIPAKGKVWVDPIRVSQAVYDALLVAAGDAKASAVVERQSPVQMLKSVKHAVELDGMRAAHVRDAAAVVEFLAWLETTLRAHPNADGADATWNECSVADRLEACRAKQPDFVGLSFETIAGAGPNGAIIHYKAEPATCRPLRQKDVFLLDSGAQYRDGTTDITRTVHFGAPTAFEKRCNTRVLQGHIALARAVFPPGTPGTALDALARVPLWSDGLNYNHGTGHGVGAFLNVHEGPQGIAAVVREGSAAGVTPLTAGMIVSNEPGYYHVAEAGSGGAGSGGAASDQSGFGIRIENLVAVVPAATPHRFEGKQYLTFETITVVPFDRNLMDLTLLAPHEIAWVDAYHAKCRAAVAPLLDPKSAAAEWLHRNTEPLAAAAPTTAAAASAAAAVKAK